MVTPSYVNFFGGYYEKQCTLHCIYLGVHSYQTLPLHYLCLHLALSSFEHYSTHARTKWIHLVKVVTCSDERRRPVTDYRELRWRMGNCFGWEPDAPGPGPSSGRTAHSSGRTAPASSTQSAPGLPQDDPVSRLTASTLMTEVMKNMNA
jgi:hypothetical protein